MSQGKAALYPALPLFYKAGHETHIRDHYSNYRPGDLTHQTPG
jgi:hypothetical protein